jgi:hypothetical protein
MCSQKYRRSTGFYSGMYEVVGKTYFVQALINPSGASVLVIAHFIYYRND